MIEIYTDGACCGNPGRGGWAWVRVENGVVVASTSGREESETTNNRMEVYAALSALWAISGPAQLVRIYSDSRYLVDGASRWVSAWKRRGWMTKGRQPVKNRDLWEALDAEISRHKIQWHWVKGHNGNRFNEMCDQAANAEAGITERYRHVVR